MKELEEVLGAPLIERGARQVRLTALGESFAVRARDILRAVDELKDLARASRGPLSGQLRMGVIPTIAPYLLPAVITRLAGRFPGLDLRIREAVTEKLIDALSAGELDTAIVALPVSVPSFTECALFEEEFVLVRPLADAALPVPHPEGLRNMRLLLLEEGHCFRDQALSFCNISPAARRDVMEGTCLSTLVQMVGAGQGVTLVPRMAVPIETDRALVCIARLHPPRPFRTIGMIWRSTNPLAESFAHIGEVVRQASGAP